MLNAITQRELAACTGQESIHAMVGLSRHFRRSPDRLTADDVQPGHHTLPALRQRPMRDDWLSSAAAVQPNRQQQRQRQQRQRLVPRPPSLPRTTVNAED